MANFDLTPSPNVLIALTHTPMAPLDAMCELIDNAIDSFSMAELKGISIAQPVIVVSLPKVSDIGSGSSLLRILDNGPGMTGQEAERAIKAGFSGNNPFDTLGLFGMGFNIATGKLGRETKLMTWTQDGKNAISVAFNLQKLVENKSYLVPTNSVEKPDTQKSGTVVEVRNWWPDGHANAGFVSKLVKYGVRKIREELGRRYATILRRGKIKIYVNDEPCEAFEHCAWADNRYVTRHGNQIPAVIRFDHIVGNQKRCTSCFALVPPEDKKCPGCGSEGFRTIEERVRGWIGIQRFDHETDFGVDLVRNGRAIRVAEKAAFFEFTDEFKKTTKDYPIDQPYGRIIGEVSLNHVPVDFMKQDFQRSSGEWQRAMSYLRGESSLQPNQPGADKNTSPTYKLYQGYRRVRTPGKADLYMGYWDPEEQKPKRISRDIERQYLARFGRREPGFFDDTEWFKSVEQADQKPLEELVTCPHCENQNLKSADACALCGFVLIGKKCCKVECGETIPESAVSCPHCGTSQIPEIEVPWSCKVCGASNGANASVCGACGAGKGLEDPLSKEYLLANSNLDDGLTARGASISLPDGSQTMPIDVLVYVTTVAIRPYGVEKKQLPLIAFRGDKLDIFLDPSHSICKTYHVRPEDLIAEELALFLMDTNRRLAGGAYSREFSLTTLRWQITRTFWGGRLEESADLLQRDIKKFLREMLESLPQLMADLGDEVFRTLSETDQKNLSLNIINAGRDISNFSAMIADDSYLSFVEPETIIELFDRYPHKFFDGAFWKDAYMEIKELGQPAQEHIRQKTRSTYRNWLEDLITITRINTPAPIQVSRGRKSLQLLQEKIA